MKLVRLQTASGTVYAEKRGDRYFDISGSVFGDFCSTDREVFGNLVVPVTPSKIVALGLNYRKHAEEFGQEAKPQPLIFLKPTSAVIGDGENIILPQGCGRVEHEGELAVVMGRRCKNVCANKAKEYILGYTCANDVSDRDIQKSDGQWTRAKGFDTFCPIGSEIETQFEPDDAEITVTVNGQVKQRGNIGQMINGVYETVSFISKVMTLNEGDVILTGTPSGVSPIKDGDKVKVCIQGVSTLTNKVVQEK
ncbi:MAG: fumarylacetoacetate hydrolase family protein [Corallococcus sp.]|nr:fumarylacetoacetate hydrolase family protein [Corallococcus sp.]